MASLFADKAVELLSERDRSRIGGLRKDKVTNIGLEESCKTEKPLDLSLPELGECVCNITTHQSNLCEVTNPHKKPSLQER